MPSRNDITGDLIQTKGLTRKDIDDFRERGLSMSIEERKRKVREHNEQRAREKHQKAVERRQRLSEKSYNGGAFPQFYVDNFEPFQSMVTHDHVTNKRQLQYELESNNCRVYEGREAEQKEADRNNAYKDAEMEAAIEDSILDTYHQIEHGYLTPKDHNNEVQAWTFGEDDE